MSDLLCENHAVITGISRDTIYRQAAIDYFVTNVGFHDEDGYPIEDSDELRKIWTEFFDGIPSAQPELPIKEKCTVCPHCDNCDVNDDGTIAR